MTYSKLIQDNITTTTVHGHYSGQLALASTRS